MLLAGWAVALYFYKKGDKTVGSVIFLVWFAILMRLNLFLLIAFSLFDISAKNLPAFMWTVFRWFSDIVISFMVLFTPILFACIFYYLFKKKFVYAALVLMLIFPAHFSYVESYFLFYPLIDTTKSEKFTLRNFDKIEPGMTRAQVRTLIGDPVENAGQYGEPCEGQTSDNAAPFLYDFAWLASSVCYDESDKVIATKKMWIPD